MLGASDVPSVKQYQEAVAASLFLKRVSEPPPRAPRLLHERAAGSSILPADGTRWCLRRPWRPERKSDGGVPNVSTRPCAAASLLLSSPSWPSASCCPRYASTSGTTPAWAATSSSPRRCAIPSQPYKKSEALWCALPLGSGSVSTRRKHLPGTQKHLHLRPHLGASVATPVAQVGVHAGPQWHARLVAPLLLGASPWLTSHQHNVRTFAQMVMHALLTRYPPGHAAWGHQTQGERLLRSAVAARPKGLAGGPTCLCTTSRVDVVSAQATWRSSGASWRFASRTWTCGGSSGPWAGPCWPGRRSASPRRCASSAPASGSQVGPSDALAVWRRAVHLRSR